MKYQESLAQRELVIEDLPKSQQKKISELEKLVDKIEEIEADVDDDSREEFEAIKSQANQADEELVSFIAKFDVEKAREQRARLAEMRSRIKKPVEKVEKEQAPAPVVPTPAPVSTPEPEPVSVPVAPVQENEQSIGTHIQELKKEAQISPEDFNLEEEQEEEEYVQPRYPQPQPVEVEAEEEFEKQGERKPRKVNIPLVVMGVGALLLTWGAVNFFKERR